MNPTPPVVVSQTLRRRRGLTEYATVAAVDQAFRRLRLPTIRAVLDEALAVAGKEQLSYQASLPNCCWQSVMTGTGGPRSAGSNQLAYLFCIDELGYMELDKRGAERSLPSAH